MDNLSDQEMALLGLMAQGQSMMAIGAWEKPMEALVAKGYATRHDQFNHSITPAGRVVFEGQEDAVIREMIEVNNKIVVARQNAELLDHEADLKDTLKAVLHLFGPEGAQKVTALVLEARKARCG